MTPKYGSRGLVGIRGADGGVSPVRGSVVKSTGTLYVQGD